MRFLRPPRVDSYLSYPKQSDLYEMGIAILGHYQKFQYFAVFAAKDRDSQNRKLLRNHYRKYQLGCVGFLGFSGHIYTIYKK